MREMSLQECRRAGLPHENAALVVPRTEGLASEDCGHGNAVNNLLHPPAMQPAMRENICLAGQVVTYEEQATEYN